MQLLIEARTSLADLLREALGLTGTNVGCEQGVCGACNVVVDGAVVRACLRLAVQCEGAVIETVEALVAEDDVAEIKSALLSEYAVQCGFCTSGLLITLRDALQQDVLETDEDIRAAIQGNICRCTGYVAIVRAVRQVLDGRRDGERK